MAETWPFLARERDLARVLAALRSHSAVVIGGSAGVGKSRLAHEVLRRLGPQRLLGVVRATASTREIPLGCLFGVIPGVEAEPGAPDLSRFGRAVAALGPRDGRDVLLIDDAHQLDDVSAAAIRQLAGGALTLVLTVRTGEAVPHAVSDLWKDELAARVELEPLDHDQTAVVLKRVLGGPLEAPSARRLHGTSGGNLLWLRHLVDDERAAGRLRRDTDHWVWSGAVDLSPVLLDLVTARLGRLDDAEARVLECLGLVEPLDLAILEGLAGADAVEDVAQRGLISVDPDEGRWLVRLGHPLYGEAVRNGAAPARLRRSRAEISDALARAEHPRPDDDLRRAVLDLDTDRPPDPKLLLVAAGQAQALTDYDLAERLLRNAVDAGAGVDARTALAGLLVYLLRADEADEVLAAATAAARDRETVTRSVLVRAMFMHFTLAEDGERVLRDAEPQGKEDPTFDGLRSVIAMCLGRTDEAEHRGERALHDPSSSDDTVALGAWGAAYSRAFSGRGEALHEVVERGIAACARSALMTPYTANIGFAEILDADHRGRPELASDRLAWAHGLSGHHAPVWVALYEGWFEFGAGSARAAIRRFEAVLTVFPGSGGGWSGWLLAMIAQAHGMLGDSGSAAEALTSAEARWHRYFGAMRFQADLARGWVAAAQGDVAAAIDACREGAERCRLIGFHAAEVTVRQAAVRFGDREQVSRLAELDRILGTPRSSLAAAHATALAEQDPGRLLRVAAELDDAGLTLDAADAAGQAAAVARRGGRTLLAAEAEGRAHTLAARLDGIRTPALAGARSFLTLSVREREVAVLAGQGLTNRQIAERLQVSVRTVESHIYRACTRLGLADRATFVAVAGARRSGMQ